MPSTQCQCVSSDFSCLLKCLLTGRLRFNLTITGTLAVHLAKLAHTAFRCSSTLPCHGVEKCGGYARLFVIMYTAGTNRNKPVLVLYV
jgi:hypothetical protein